MREMKRGFLAIGGEGRYFYDGNGRFPDNSELYCFLFIKKSLLYLVAHKITFRVITIFQAMQFSLCFLYRLV